MAATSRNMIDSVEWNICQQQKISFRIHQNSFFFCKKRKRKKYFSGKNSGTPHQKRVRFFFFFLFCEWKIVKSRKNHCQRSRWDILWSIFVCHINQKCKNCNKNSEVYSFDCQFSFLIWKAFANVGFFILWLLLLQPKNVKILYFLSVSVCVCVCMLYAAWKWLKESWVKSISLYLSLSFS